MTAFHNTSNLRLEVEAAPGATPNLVQNPSGEYGAWSWLSPVANTAVNKVATGLEFRTTAAQAAYFTTDFMPVAAGRLVAATMYVGGGTAGYTMKMRLDWYNASKVLLSSSTQSPAFSTTLFGAKYTPIHTAPANTAYTKLRVDLYQSDGVSNPAANTTLIFKQAMVTHSTTVTPMQDTRTNLIQNPTFGVDAANWLLDFGTGTLARSTTQASSGTASLAFTCTAGIDGFTVRTKTGTGDTTGMPVTAGQTYALQHRYWTPVAGQGQRGRIQWINASSGQIGATVTVYTTTTGASIWNEGHGTAVAPVGAVYARVTLDNLVSTVGQTYYMDSVIFEKATSIGVNDYFDGSTAAVADKTYAWSGTAHLSNSVETRTSFPFTEPAAWTNILGPTHEISVTRKELDVGLLSATIYDATLDPATSTALRPGKKMRVQALVAGTWQHIFEGKLTGALVTYDKEKEPGAVLRARINISASDAIAHMSNQGEPRGVALVSELPYLLEGRGIPWNVNGSGSQVAAVPTIVSLNDNASLVDQVAITRDSTHGFAWVDRFNTLQVWDGATMIPATMSSVVDGDFEVSSGNWSGTNATLTSVTTQAYTGTRSLRITATAAGNATASTTPPGLGIRVKPSTVYEFSAQLRAATTIRNVQVGISFYNAAGGILGTAWSSTDVVNTTGWKKIGRTDPFTPTNARYAKLEVTVVGAAAGEQVFVDDVRIEDHNYDLTDQPSTDPETTSYSEIDTSFSTERCINQVLVKWLHWDGVAGASTEVPYGPYMDALSIDTWGARKVEFTIHGPIAQESEANMSAFASQVMAANAVPVVRANSVKVPVKDPASLGAACLVDLYSPMAISYDTKLTKAPVRVVEIKHDITPDKWTVEYTFETPESVANPTWVPSPPVTV